LVHRHVDVVYAVALRGCGGDVYLAQDVQGVFADLVRKTSTLTSRESLAGWLYLAARNAAAMAIRTERRRRAREQEAQTIQQLDSDPALKWEPLRPVLVGRTALEQQPDAERGVAYSIAATPWISPGLPTKESSNTSTSQWVRPGGRRR
jgi:DNA-directed RNA polymerase specialized sigma24 family protein